MEEVPEQRRRLVWLVDTLDVLRGFAASVRQKLSFALYQAQVGDTHETAKPLHGFGAPVWEIRADDRSGSPRPAARPSVVDLGLVYDLRVRGDVVHVLMTMPHRGRPRLGYFSYGSGGNSTPVRTQLLKVPGVRKVVVEQTWNPPWDANRLTDEGRRKLGIP